MIALYIILAVLAVAVLLFLVSLFRASGGKKSLSLLTWTDEDKGEKSRAYAETLSKMIQIPTVSRPAQKDFSKVEEFRALLEKEFPLVHKTLTRNVLQNGLLYKWQGKTSAEAVVLMSHHDVVAASGKWSKKPFGGEIIDGKIYGRGAFDTKSSLFAIFQAIEELIGGGFTPDFDVYISSSCDEECDSDQANYAVKFLKENGANIALVLDEGGAVTRDPIGGVKGDFALIGVTEKGYADIKFTAGGKGGHASIQQKNTPLARIAAFVNYVEKHDPFSKKLNGTVAEMFHRMAPYSNFPLRLIFSNLWLYGGLLKNVLGSVSPSGGAMLKTTINFTTCKGSESLNAIPVEAFVTANVRFISHQNEKESVEILKKIAAKFGLETEVLQSNPACRVVPYESEKFKFVENVAKKVFDGAVVTPYLMTGGTDARHYDQACEAVLRFSPIYVTSEQLDGMHGLDENIDIKVLPRAVSFYKTLLTDYGKQ